MSQQGTVFSRRSFLGSVAAVGAASLLPGCRSLCAGSGPCSKFGGVQVGDDCEIGANTTIDRGAIEDTVLGPDVRLDNQIQIAHNVRVGAHTAMAGCVAVAGSTTIGRYCMIGGAAGIAGHLEICDRVVVTAMSLVTHSIREPGEYSSGTPLMDSRSWRRNAVRFKQLDALARRVGTSPKDTG